MEIRQQSFNFPKLSGSGPQSAETRIQFARSLLRAAVGIVGYSATFENREDHHLGRLTVEVTSEIDSADDKTLVVHGSFGLRDWSGEWDDDYSGNIQFVVLADLVGVAPPLPGNPRGDLVIVDAEFTQAVQHFRDSSFLDSANVFPDNAIRLVADKPTVVRLYVDYDASSGLAPIASLTGTLDVTAGGSTTRIVPIEAIVPRRDLAIRRGQRGHTLNFVIPENLCRGDIGIAARVASASDMTQFSAEFSRTLSFDPIPALPIIAVGINYTGPDVMDGATPAQLAAPTQADFINTLMLTERLFPIPQVTITSFLTMDYDEELASDISEGCDKLDDLLDAVRDMRGDSEDIVLGLFGVGVETGSVGGCGGDGAAVGRNGRGNTAAHELGHALGLQHAPCDNVTRCDEPANTDDNYPHFSGYDSDSIGEFGFDVFNLTVKDPADVHDIMGYSSNKWISAYNYKRLMSAVPEVGGGGPVGAAGAEAVRQVEDRGDWIKVKQPKLFLNLHIERDHHVMFRPAFHYPAYPQPHSRRRTPFTVELHDDNGKVLRHACLYASAHGPACDCGGEQFEWPLHIRQGIPFDRRAARLLILDCAHHVIYKQEIGEPPKVSVEVHGAAQRDEPNLALRWHSDCADEAWYLVQWRDARGTWRGAAPRTRKTSLLVPKALFGRQREVAIRVLASSGIATGGALWEGTLGSPDQPPGVAMQLGLAGVPAEAEGAVALGRSVRLAILHGPARPEIRWYSSRGAELGRGRSLDLSSLPPGRHALHALVLDSGHGSASAVWSIEHRPGGQFFVHLPKRPDNASQSKE